MSDMNPPLSQFPDHTERPFIMGIVNVTPDSFYDGGRYDRVEAALERVRSMVEAGVDVVDVGGESTRPGASRVPDQDELDRVVPVVEAIREEGIECPISVDTRKAVVAREALDAGADWINDVTALRHDPGMAELISDRGNPAILMHMQGTPETMQDDPTYDNVVEDVCDFFKERIEWATQQGIEEDQLIIDPGIGFGKTRTHNRRLLNHVDRLRELGRPVLVGHSRKSFLEPVASDPEERLPGTLAVSVHLMKQSVEVLRVHDVAEHRDVRATIGWLEGGPSHGG